MTIREPNYRMQLAGLIEIEKVLQEGHEPATRETAIRIWRAMWDAGPSDLRASIDDVKDAAQHSSTSTVARSV